MFNIVQIVATDSTGDTRYRMHWPAIALAEQRPDWSVLNVDASYKELKKIALAADLLVVYQTHDDSLFPVIQQRKKNNLKTIVEYNDNFYAPPAASPVHQHWSSPIIWGRYEKFMEMADAVIVTGPGLNQLFEKQAGTKLHILENHLPEVPEAYESLRKKKDTIKIGWAGSVGHMADILWIVPTLVEVASEHPEIKLSFMGNEALEREMNLPQGLAEFHKWGSMEEYYTFLESLSIGIAPLLDTPYNKCRSDIKAVELASRAVCPILQDALPYKDFITKTECPVFNNLKDLKKMLKKMLLDGHAEQAQTAYSYVKSERVFKLHTERAEIYKSMLPDSPINQINLSSNQKQGFHQIKNPVNNVSEVAHVISSAQNLLKDKKFTEALDLINRYLEHNPLAADVALIKGQITLQGDREQTRAMLKEYSRLFPRDLRFSFRLLQTTRDLAEWNDLWKQIVILLKQEPNAFSKFYYPLVIKQLQIKGLAESDISMLEDLSTIYPFSTFIKFALMQLLQKQGNFKVAATLAKDVKEAIEFYSLDKSFLDQGSLNYVTTWESALKARLN